MPKAGTAGRPLDCPIQSVKLASSPMENPAPNNQEIAHSMRFGSQISMASVVRMRDPFSMPDNSNTDTTAA